MRAREYLGTPTPRRFERKSTPERARRAIQTAMAHPEAQAKEIHPARWINKNMMKVTKEFLDMAKGEYDG
jgi:hypothetical protein